MLNIVRLNSDCPRPKIVNRLSITIGLILAVFLSANSHVKACKYTVRDVAFVEMGHSQYRLYLYVDNDTNSEYTDLLQNSAQRVLQATNVHLDFVTVDQNASDESLSYLRAMDIETFPSAVLVSPKGKAKLINLPPASERRPESIQQAIKSIVQSPKRKEILTKLPNAHSIVLIIESEDETQNQLAKTMAEKAIKRILATYPDLPKAIDGPPLLMSMSLEEAQRESLFLWSLGVDVEASDQTQIAMIFGRGRNLGPVVKVKDVDQQDLIRTLAIVGLDCECELDRSWMQAPMIPHVWAESDESLAAKALGFDPGHPLVKVEISRILSRGPSSQEGIQLSTDDILLPGLQIIELNFDDEDPLPETQQPDAIANKDPTSNGPASNSGSAELEHVSPVSAPDDSASKTVAADPTSHPDVKPSSDTQSIADSEGERGTDRVLSATFLGLAILGLLGGGFVVLLGRRSGP